MAQLTQRTKDMIYAHKKEVELFQWAVMNSIGSLVYSEYLSEIQTKQYPRTHYMIPAIRKVAEILSIDNTLMRTVAGSLVDSLTKLPHMDELITITPELDIFSDEWIESTNEVLSSYILPNVSFRVPETIAKKFQVGDPSVKGIIDESGELDIFRDGMLNGHYDYIIEETRLQLLWFIESTHTSDAPVDITDVVFLPKDSVLTINNPSAICPIHINYHILDNTAAMKSIGLVTGLTYTKHNQGYNISFSLKSNSLSHHSNTFGE